MTKNDLVSLILIFGSIGFVVGHGFLAEPVARGSRWRYNSSAIPNYDDNSLFCGGFATQWNLNNGKCGLCGDDYAKQPPRLHELGGLYGEGVIVEKYRQGQVISVIVMLTANHRGHFEFKICNLDTNNRIESEACFSQYRLLTGTGEDKYPLPSDDVRPYQFTLRLPANLVCKHCVLQWTYVTGNSWGFCDEAETHGALGCGIQENFRTCSDIAILPV